ncbi:MAG: hypothetical protein ACK54E_09950 [Pseudanabaena sp.]|jgi:hypothetical protein|nr:hypothetical protein [Pseudanabaena sp. M090S1SP2A07QC]MCA6507524.1 hypothetical protein [Pseudanabaena sp. M172S2SP2A07QC]MCA6522658.1 hypothetical protein [Pseudanabaena sp. M051S1SP2A07QC]MCA6525607.1 hypothetical protein [Pseudanabaena sp. M179S2SP2A07QC]MCA6529790.1 hypothetical protein [Pseudanabaena sp. M125S2SP2A07QC]MCA6533133.1 hypothetical protein [Pseudanabaena sp. M176S2SP2A07QC]MCA6539567.1 hypothetical protein [Pseudanabaena sp. M037S2SP2A07QC]MCA6545004.1 hypothetical prot
MVYWLSRLSQKSDMLPKAIAKVIANVLGDNLYLSQFAMVADLEPMKQWTEPEAVYMADRNYRQTYLIN